MCDSGCTASSASRPARGASTRSQPNQSLADISASSARIRAGRSGWPGTSWARCASWRNQGEAGTRVRYGNGPARRSRRRGSRGRGALRGPVRRPRGRERHADLGPPARRDRLLLGAGRPRRRARRRRLAAAPPRGHAGRGPRDRAPLGRRGALRGGAGALPRPRADRRALRRRPPRPPRARARGRPRRPPRRARGRERDRPPDPAHAVGRRGGARADRRARGPPRRRARDGRRRRARSSTTAGRSAPAPSCSPRAAPPRCGRARPTRRGPSAPG